MSCFCCIVPKLHNFSTGKSKKRKGNVEEIYYKVVAVCAFYDCNILDSLLRGFTFLSVENLYEYKIPKGLFKLIE